jgi:hypothetical protein
VERLKAYVDSGRIEHFVVVGDPSQTPGGRVPAARSSA